MDSDSCLICKKDKTDLITRCNHKYHEECIVEIVVSGGHKDCLLCGGPISYVQQLEDLKSNKTTLTDIFDLNSSNEFDEDVIFWAVEHGDVDLVRAIARFGYELKTEYFVNMAAESGQVEMLEHLIDEFCGWTNGETIYRVIKANQLEMVKHLIESRCLNHDPHVLWWAAFHGKLEIVRYLVEECDVYYQSDFVDAAAEKGHLDIVKYFVRKDQTLCSPKAIYNAARYGHFDTVQYLLSINADFTVSAVEIAASHGHHEIVNILVEDVRLNRDLDISEYLKYLTID